MSALNFMKQFAGPVERREKRQTIRAKNSGHAVGRPIQLYTGMRTKACRKLVGVDPVCTSIEPVTIPNGASLIVNRMKIGDRMLSPVECIDMAHADGFASYLDFCNFFRTDAGHFEGFLIRWDWQGRAGHFNGYRGQGHIIAPGATEMED